MYFVQKITQAIAGLVLDTSRGQISLDCFFCVSLCLCQEVLIVSKGKDDDNWYSFLFYDQVFLVAVNSTQYVVKLSTGY